MSVEYTQFTISGLPRWISNLQLKIWLKYKICLIRDPSMPIASVKADPMFDNVNLHVNVNQNAEDYWWDEMNGIVSSNYTADVIILDNDISKLVLTRLTQSAQFEMSHPIESGKEAPVYSCQVIQRRDFPSDYKAEVPPILSPTEVVALRRKWLTLDAMYSTFNSSKALDSKLGTITSVSFGSFAQGSFHSAGIWNQYSNSSPGAPPINSVAIFDDILRIGLQASTTKDQVPGSWIGQWCDTNLRNVKRVLIEKGSACLYLELAIPPRFYERSAKIEKPSLDTISVDDTRTWLDVVNRVARPMQDSTTLALKAMQAMSTYRIPFPYTAEMQNVSKVLSWQMQTARTVRITADPKTIENVRKLFNLSGMQGKLKEIRQINLIDNRISRYQEDLRDKWTTWFKSTDYTYEIYIRMHKAVTNGIFHPWDLDEIKAWFVLKFPKPDQLPAFLDFIDRPQNRAAAHELRHIVDANVPVFHVSERLDRYKKKFDTGNTSGNFSSLLFKAFIYPSHMELGYDKSKDNSCRMLRQNWIQRRRFMKVAFVEDKQELRQLSGPVEWRYVPMRADPRADSSKLIRQRVVLKLTQPISMGGRDFDFLAYSGSGLREREVYFFSAIGNITANTLRDRIGDWKNETQLMKSPSKWAARMGLAFTSTWFYPVALPKGGWTVLPDKKTDGQLAFTDGIGMMHPKLAQQIRLYKRGGEYSTASAFQVRFCGKKGMLCEASESCFPSPQGTQIIFRDSMEKFKVERETTKPQYLEIAGFTRLHQKPPRFTWPLIKIMEGLFSSSSQQQRFLREAFSLQGAQTVDGVSTLPEFSGLLFSRLRSTAARNLRARRFDLENVIWYLDTLDKNWEDISGTILHSVLRKVAGEEWDKVCFRKKPPIPNAILVKGVLDEYGFLDEGQVYVRHQNTTYEGPVLIYRSPINLPGDVQRVTAISDKELDQKAGKKSMTEAKMLKSLNETVAFSSRGSRPLPNMLSGGDLDGDDYVIIPEMPPSTIKSSSPSPSFVPPKTDLLDAMPFLAAPKAKELPGNKVAGITDVAEFVGTFMQHECTGPLTNLLLRLSDLPSYLLPADDDVVRRALWSNSCKIVGEKLSQSVDFAKHGNTVSYEEVAEAANFDLKRLPDFLAMENNENERYGKYYVSNSLPGVLYRCMNQAKFDPSEFQNLKIRHLVLDPDDPTELPASAVPPQLRSGLAPLISEYRRDLWRLLTQSAQPHDLADDEIDLVFFDPNNFYSQKKQRAEILGKALDSHTTKFLRALETLTKGPPLINIIQTLIFTWYTGCTSLAQLGDVPAGFGSSFLLLVLGKLMTTTYAEEEHSHVDEATGSSDNKNGVGVDDDPAFFDPMPEVDPLPVQDEADENSEDESTGNENSEEEIKKMELMQADADDLA